MSRRHRRRGVLAALLAVGVLTGITAFGSTGGAATKKTVTITWWDYFVWADKDMGALLSAYEKSHPGVTIKRSAIGYADFATKYKQGIATRSTPDMAAFDAGLVPSFAGQHAFLDLSKNVKSLPAWKQIFPAFREQVTVKGKVWGVPMRGNTQAIMYNADVLGSLGVKKPPATWDELRDVAKKATTSSRSGLCFPAANDETGSFNLLPWLYQAGSDVPKIGDAASVKALTFIDTLVNTDKSVPKSVLGWTWDPAHQQFVAGNCVMNITGPWNYAAAKKDAKFQIGVSMLPAGPGGRGSSLGGEAWVVGAGSKNAAEVWKLIQWLAQNKNSWHTIAGATGSLPVRKDQLKLKDSQWAPDAWIKAMQYARPRSAYGTQWSAISSALNKMEQEVLTGSKSPADAAKEAKATIQPLLPKS
jgi:multiple sugar transport system substrate-binding protein